MGTLAGKQETLHTSYLQLSRDTEVSSLLKSKYILLSMLLYLAISSLAQAQLITPFQERFKINTRGLITLIGNGSMSCQDTVADCAAARNGALVPSSRNDNNAFIMSYVDVDDDPLTFNSSLARLTLPANAEILWAGLYWGGDSAAGVSGSLPPAATLRNQVQLQTPASAGYVTIPGEILGSATFAGDDYAVFADITDLVSQGRNGAYMVADIQSGTGFDRYAGWSLAVIYGVPGLNARNITVFDGFAQLNTTVTDLSIPVSGFFTPPAGPVVTRVGVLAFEGDIGIINDSMELTAEIDNIPTTTQFSGINNPPDNLFNSSMTNEDQRMIDRDPAYPNLMAVDLDLFSTSGALGNNETQAVIDLRTMNDFYFPTLVTFSTDLFSPTLDIEKTITDINGGVVEPGDILQYQVTLTNPDTSLDTITLLQVSDMVPENTSYVADSLVVTSGANAGNKTDGGGDDQAEFDSANNQVQFRLGNGADAVNGGNLLIGENSSFRFRVQVNPGTPANSQIENVATADFVGLITGIPDTINSVPVISIVQVPELSIIKTSNPNPVAAGAPLVYTLSFTNIGTASATGVVISDPLPAQTTFLSATGNGVLNGTTLIWNIGTLDAGESGSVSYIVRVDDPLPAGTTITNSAVIDSNQTPPITTQTVTPVTSTPVLELSKQASSSLVEAGSQLIYTLTFGNTGNEDASNVILSDTIPVNTTFVSASDNGVFDPSGNTVTWNLGILNAGASGSVTLTVQVVSPLPTGTVIANAAVIDSTETPPVSTQVQTPVGSAPVLNLSKDANSTVVGSGAQISYTLNYSNTGSEDASGVVLSDSIPPNTSFVSASDGGSFDAAANSVIWNLGLIAAGAGGSVSLTIQVDSSVPSGTPIINNAILTSNEVPPVNTQTQTPVASLPILTLNKQSDSETTTAGASLTYTLTYRNTGNVTATGVVLTDLLPPDTTFVAASNSGVFDPAANTVVWNLGTLVVAESGSVTVTIQIDAAAAAGSLIINLSDIVSAETPPVVAQALTPVGLVTIIIPTLSTLSLLMLAIMLGIFGMINRRYRI